MINRNHVAGILAVLVIMSSTGAAAFVGSCGTVLNSPGKYVLENDLTGCAGAFAIKITSDDVDLDLNGHVISGSGGGFGVYIFNADDVTVKNGAISDFHTGIEITRSTRVEISKAEISANDIGVRALSSDDIVISENTIIFNNENGVDISSGSHTIKGNTVDANGSDGIKLSRVTSTRIDGNKIRDNMVNGLSVYNSTDVNILNNLIQRNTVGVFLSRVGDSRFHNNTLCHNDYGIEAHSSSNNNQFNRNNFVGSTGSHAVSYGVCTYTLPFGPKTKIVKKKDNWEYNYWEEHDCDDSYVIDGTDCNTDDSPNCHNWRYNPQCEEDENTASISGYKFWDREGDGEWTDCNYVLMNDQFDDGVLGTWTPIRGTWVEEDGFMKQLDTSAGFPNSPIIYNTEKKFPLYLAYQISVTPMAGNRDFGVIFFANSATDYFLFRVNGPQETLGVYRRNGSVLETIHEVSFANVGIDFPIENGTTYGIKVLSDDSMDRLYIYLEKIEMLNQPGSKSRFYLDRDVVIGCSTGYLGFWTNYSAVNYDWARNSADPVLEGWEINLTGPVNRKVYTDADGVFEFPDLPPGTYTVYETQQFGWLQTVPLSDSYEITLEADEHVNCLLFGNYYVELYPSENKTSQTQEEETSGSGGSTSSTTGNTGLPSYLSAWSNLSFLSFFDGVE